MTTTSIHLLQKKKLLSLAVDAAYIAGEYIKNSTKNRLVLKDSGKDIKIGADIGTQKIILDFLKENSKILVLSEEDNTHDFSNEINWIVDPLDGSINYLRGIPNSAISIALKKKDEIILGVIFDFNHNEMFSGIVGEGAKLNGEKISVSNISDVEKAIMMSGFPSYTDYSQEALERYIKFVQNFKKVRLLGSSAISLAYIACGRADVYYENDIKIWDVAAGLAIVKAAGGSYDISPVDKSGGCEVYCSNSRINKGLLRGL